MSDDSPPPDNVLRPSFGQPSELGKQTEIKRGRRKCYHHGAVALDETTRAVTCRACGDPLDAFEVLLEYANRERRWCYYDGEIREATARLAELKKEERRTKARLKHALRKDPVHAVAQECERTERMRMKITEWARDIGQASRRIERVARAERAK